MNKKSKNGDFDPKMVENIFGIVFILTAAKNYTSNFVDSYFGPDYCSSSNASVTAPSNQFYFQYIFKTFQIIVGFTKMVIFSFLKYSSNSNLWISKCPDLIKILHLFRPHKVTIKVVYKHFTLFQFQLIILYFYIFFNQIPYNQPLTLF